jgi:hypothetical protein
MVVRVGIVPQQTWFQRYVDMVEISRYRNYSGLLLLYGKIDGSLGF